MYFSYMNVDLQICSEATFIMTLDNKSMLIEWAFLITECHMIMDSLAVFDSFFYVQ